MRGFDGALKGRHARKPATKRSTKIAASFAPLPPRNDTRESIETSSLRLVFKINGLFWTQFRKFGVMLTERDFILVIDRGAVNKNK